MRKVNKKGVVFISVMCIILVLGIGITAFMTFSKNEIYTTRRRIESTKAFYLAQAGLNRALYDLKEEFEADDGDDNWNDGDINGTSAGPNSSSFYPLYSSSLGDGTYTVSLKNVGTTTDEIRVKSSGTVGSRTRTIQADVKASNISPWNNAVFAGAGSGSTTVTGGVFIHGSVHILGTDLASTDVAIDLTGGAGIGNNYDGLPAELSSRIPDCPTVTFGGETVDSLSSTFRVKKGRVDLGGASVIGEPDVPGDAQNIKETIDGCYVDVDSYDGDNAAGTYYDGFGGNKGASNVSSDNGTTNAYDLGKAAAFPSLDDAYDSDSSYREHLTDESLSISEDTLSNINSTTPDFSYSDAKGSISWVQATSILNISGIVRIYDGTDADTVGDFSLGANFDLSNNVDIEYTGKGTIFTDNIEVHGDLLSKYDAAIRTFPDTHCLGLVADGDMNLASPGDAQLKMTGAFYAEGTITSAMQNDIAGTFVANYFNMGSQVPKIYYVPSLLGNLPPGMPEAESNWTVTTSNWHEI
ncbi:hypothetical protein KAU86_04105 [bacterium]|nr:hypothetical protein [bacterium]